MDYEKAYKQLVEDFGIILNLNTVKESGVISVEDVRKLIPELAESEEERIRTFLHHTFTAQYLCKDKLGKWHGEPVVNILAWLEKQGEQKFVDKIKPKFKVGDWLVENKPNNYARIIQILEVVDIQGKEMYRISRDLYNDEDVVEYRFIENNYHSFTIQDAKDGDVLRIENLTFIFQEITNDNVCHKDAAVAYCSYEDNDDGFGVCGPDCITDLELVTPATKEQRELLFQKMKEAGYEWDAEKKELKKGEQKPIKVPKFKVGDFIQFNGMGHTRYTVKKVCGLSHYINTCNKRMDMSYTDANFELVEKKSSWSEEDEEALEVAIIDLEDIYSEDSPLDCYAGHYMPFDKAANQLKSIKERYTWKPSEEHIHWLKWAINRMPDTEIANEAEAELRDLLEQLEKLMEE